MHEDKQPSPLNVPPLPHPAAQDSCTEPQQSSCCSPGVRLRGGGEEGQPEAAGTSKGQQSATKSCLRLGGVYYRENGKFYIEGHRRHHVIDKLDDDGLLVGHYMVPQPRPNRSRMLDELSASICDEVRLETEAAASDAFKKEAEKDSDSLEDDLEEEVEEESEDDEEFEVPLPSDPSVASTSKGITKSSSSYQGGSRQLEPEKKGRKKKERIASRTRSKQPGVCTAFLQT